MLVRSAAFVTWGRELPALQFRDFAAAAREVAGGLFGEEFGRHKKIPEQRVTLGALGREISSLGGFAIAVADGRKLGVALAQFDDEGCQRARIGDLGERYERPVGDVAAHCFNQA